MGISKEKKKLLCAYVDYKCENCKKKFSLNKLEIHRIRPGCDGGTYEHRNCKVLCIKCHDIFSSSQRISMNIQR